MNFDFLIFPAPKQTRTLEQLPGDIFWIPKDNYLYPKFENFSPNLKPRLNRERLPMKQRSESPVESENNHPDAIDIKAVSDEFGREQDDVNVSVSPDDHDSLSIRIKTLNQNAVKVKNRTNYFQQLQRSHIIGHIPCLHLKVKNETSKVMLFFHGNSEDITLAASLLCLIKSKLNVTHSPPLYLEIPIIAIEYPGYSLYKNVPVEAEKLLQDAEYAFNYLNKKLGYQEENIIVFGRSIGSGPATYLASKKNPGCLCLMSPFTSLKCVVKDYLGSWAGCVLKERFDNLENMKKVKCPTFIVHGQKDTLIPYSQSVELISPCELILPEKMTHTSYHYFYDLVDPLMKFLDHINFDLNQRQEKKIIFPKELYRKPK